MDYSSIYDQNIALFDGIARADLSKMLDCLGATVSAHHSGSFILMTGEMTHHIGIILSGRATVYRDDVLGNRTIITTLGPADLFAETFVCAGVLHSPVTVQAGTDTIVLKISFHRIIRPCVNACPFHSTLVQNMLRILASKNLKLSEKIDHISRKTTRQKLVSYLLSQAATSDALTFAIPFDRQALSEYLGVNRSALSRELSRIRDIGVLDYRKNVFTILNMDALNEMLVSE